MIKKPLAYISAAWSGTETENMEAARRYCRAVYEAGFSPICPRLYLPLFIDDATTTLWWMPLSRIFPNTATLNGLSQMIPM